MNNTTIASWQQSQTLSEILEGNRTNASLGQAQGQWYAAIAALESLLLEFPQTPKPQGIILCGPSPVLQSASLLSQFYIGLFTPKSLKDLHRAAFQLPAAKMTPAASSLPLLMEYPLLPLDPLGEEQFCLVLTAQFGLVLVWGRQFHFSFAPEDVTKCWEFLRSRLILTSHQHRHSLENLIEQWPIPEPNYRLVSNFTRYLLQSLPEPLPYQETRLKTRRINTYSDQNLNQKRKNNANIGSSETPPSELELLQAFTHEIKTPLTTIRTLTRLLLKKRCNFKADVSERLEVIDRECTEQINRMELIFRAAELKNKPGPAQGVQLMPISLQHLIEQNIPQWQQQAQRRNITLDFILPEHLPTVVSNSAMLDRVLTGLMESLTRSLPTGGEIKVKLITAGSQLKLQLFSEKAFSRHSLKSLGQLLVFQPETGSLSLNLDVTKNLFQVMGGKMTVRQVASEGEVLTIFLPLDQWG